MRRPLKPITTARFLPDNPVLQTRPLLFRQQHGNQMRNRLFDTQRRVIATQRGSNHPGAITTSGRDAERAANCA